MASGQERSNSEQVRGQQRAENRDGNSSTNALFDLTGASNMNLDLRGLVVQNFPKLPAATPSVLSPDRQRDMEEQFIAIFNTFTNEKTQDKVTSTFLNLNNPDGQVNPEFVVTNYYQGETSPTSSEYVPTLSRNFDPHRDVIGQIVPLKNILNGVCYVALVASAGSGKTISAKRFARMALRKELSSLAGVVLIHYVNIAELDWKSAHTAFDLLFVQPLGARLNKEFRDFGFEWMKTNANKVLLVLDGLDQAPWYMKEEITISYDNPAAAPVVFHNVLNKDLLHDCRIVITSREHSIRHFKQPIRPHRTVTLSGLTIENREYLMKQLGGEHGEGIWKHLQSHSPGLVSLCETPAFLVFTAAVLIDNLENPPTTMTGVLARVLLYFLNSEQQRAPGDIEETFDKLTSLAFKGTSERRVIFKGSELRASGLSVEKVSDFVAIAPKRTRTHHFKIMEGNMNLFFCHQLIQEALSALRVAQLSSKDFQTFVTEHFNDPHFKVVIQIVIGVILNPDIEIDDLCDIQEKTSKVLILQTWLRGKVNAAQNQSRAIREDLPSFSLLHECGNGAKEIVRNCVHSVRSMEKLKGEKLFVFASILNKTVNIQDASFSTLCLSDWDAKILFEGLSKCRRVKILVLRVSELHKEESFQLLGKILTIAVVENLIFSKCLITEEKMFKMNSAIDISIQQDVTLDFSGTFQIEIRAFFAIGVLVKKINACDIQLNLCQLSHEKLYYLKEALKGYDRQIKQLGISGNDEMYPESMRHVGEIVKIGKTEHINASRCRLNLNHLQEFEKGLQGYTGQIKRLDISRNDTMTPRAYQHMGSILIIGKVQNLNLCHCKLETYNLGALKEHSNGFSGHMESLDVAWNGTNIDYNILGQIVENWKLKELICHGCFNEQRHFDDFFRPLREMRNKVMITHGSENIPSTTTTVEEFRQKISRVTNYRE